jgi:hypothetical protein
MLLRSGRTRPGISLLEVLTAIFIMGIGMLALLTLFPLGALSMARGIRDDRAAHIAANASALAIAFDLRQDDNVQRGLNNLNNNSPPTMDDPNLLSMDTADTTTNKHDLVGNAVYVDPFYATFSNRLGRYPPTGPPPPVVTPGLIRVTASFATTPQARARWFTFQDEITFDPFGRAKVTVPGNPPTIDRPGTYSHAYLIRRPRFGTREVSDLTVVVYAQRNTESGVVEGEDTIYNAPPPPPANQWMGTSGNTTLTVNYSGFPKPDFRKGTWILDTTYDAATRTVNAHFYRVETATETGATQFTLELDRPLKANVSTICVMKNVIAVVERGTAPRLATMPVQ